MSRRKREQGGTRTLLSALFLRVFARLCACLLILGLVGQTLIVGPLPRVRASVTQLPAPVSAPPAPYSVQNRFSFSDGAARSLTLAFLPEAAGWLASGATSLFWFAEPKMKESADTRAGFEGAVLEPLYETVESGESRTLGVGNSPSSPPPAGDVEFDFDGDNKADIGRWRGVATEFKVKNSNGGAYSTYTLGSSNAVAAPGDFNGDGATDACVFNGTTWTYKTSPTATAQTISWGTAGDIPYAGDYS